MRKIIFLASLLIISAVFANAQRKKIDSLKRIIVNAANDSNKVKALFQLADQYIFFKPDSGIKIGQQCYALAAVTKNTSYQRRSLILMANMYVGIGNYTKAMQIYYDALRLAKKENDDYAIIQTYNNIGSTYNQMPDYAEALQYLRMAQKKLAAYKAENRNITNKFRAINVYILNNLDETFLFSDKLDSGAYYIKAGTEEQERAHFYDLKSAFIADQGVLESKRGNFAAALKYFHEAGKADLASSDLINMDLNYFSIANVYKKMDKPDSAIFYARRALSAAEEGNYLPDVALADKLLYQLYDQQQNIPLAYKYYKAAAKMNDSLTNNDKIRELTAMDFEQKQKDQELAAARAGYQNTVRTYILIGVLAVALFMAFVFWRNALQRKRANNLLQEQKEEIESTLDQLKATQTQLIQSEKMASLGELTAGIAHEIQNPLNFVNNFSEVSAELVDEMSEELNKGDIAEAKAIGADLKQNLEKIRHHGKRADFIVKGMLEHSRTSKGEKTLTNINVLADEFFKLSYHGLRAKDKNFNAEMVTHFDETLPKIEVVQQDIGRVLLNLFNNAFYAVNQKMKTAGADYKPTVELTTFAPPSGGWGVSVKDNGNGIPDAIKDKIMQPFFTTKPTGEGTGLGLSLSYDIVMKGHGGSINMETKDGEFTEFKLTLPLA